jgi:hypothetical protein
MNLVQLKVVWKDRLGLEHVCIRPLTECECEEWVSGWFSAMSEMVGRNGGRITSFALEDVK